MICQKHFTKLQKMKNTQSEIKLINAKHCSIQKMGATGVVVVRNMIADDQTSSNVIKRNHTRAQYLQLNTPIP